MVLLSFLLQAAAPAVAKPSAWDQYQPLVMITLVAAIFYFLMIRPQQKKQKEIMRLRDAMKTGDKVVAAGGIHGRIKEIAEATILIEVSEGVRIRVEKQTVLPIADDKPQK